MSTNERPVTLNEIRQSTNVEGLRPRLEAMDDMALLELRQEPAINNKSNLSFSNWPLLGYTAAVTALTGAAIAISQPIARRMKLTSMPFRSYMKHPASLAVLGSSAILETANFVLMRKDTREVEGLRIIDNILGQRNAFIPEDPELSSASDDPNKFSMGAYVVEKVRHEGPLETNAPTIEK